MRQETAQARSRVNSLPVESSSPEVAEQLPHVLKQDIWPRSHQPLERENSAFHADCMRPHSPGGLDILRAVADHDHLGRRAAETFRHGEHHLRFRLVGGTIAAGDHHVKVAREIERLEHRERRPARLVGANGQGAICQGV